MALALDQVSVSFGGPTPVLDRLDLNIAPGEFVSLVGASGCGKSTVLRLLAGLVEADSGRVHRSDGHTVSFVFQEPNLLPWRTVVENIRLPLELLGVDPEETRSRVDHGLQLIGFSEADRQKMPGELSGGMKMRTSLARALVTHPDVLLLDEPFAALDDILREQLNEDLLEIHTTQQVTSVFVTHNVAEAVFLSDRIIVMPNDAADPVVHIPVELPRPRSPSLRGDPAFARLVGRVSGQLRGEDWTGES
tara:strand:- start:2043 stop:2789 length:747 start_codon:yes stop_codon:yes gene_type:complete